MYSQHVTECTLFPNTNPPDVTLYQIEVITKIDDVYLIHNIDPHSKKVETRPAGVDFNVNGNMFVLELHD